MSKKRKHGEACVVTVDAESGTMISIRRSDVPAYLREGQLYKSFGADDDDEEILVPNNVMKIDDSARTIADVRHLLCSLRYWLVDSAPQSIIKYVLEHRAQNCATIMQEFSKEFPFLQKLQELQVVPRKGRMVVAFTSGNLDIIRFLFQEEGLEMVELCATICAERGNAGCLQFYLSSIGTLPEGLENVAVQNGHLDCLKIVLSSGVPLTIGAAALAITFGHLACLKFCHERGVVSTKGLFCTLAAFGGRLECLKYLHEVVGCAWNQEVCIMAVHEGHLDCLVYALEQGCPGSGTGAAVAAMEGKLAFLQCFHEHGVAFDNDLVTSAAVGNNHPDYLKYALEHGCPVDPNCMMLACSRGHLRCLEILHQHGFPWDLQIGTAATRSDQLDCLKYAVEHGCPVNATTLAAARERGSVQCIAYLESVLGAAHTA